MNLGLDDLSRFHTPPAVARDGLEVVLSRLDLLYFYSNRIRSLVKKPFA